MRCPRWSGATGETGLLVPPNDPGALAVAIGRLLDAPELRAQLGEAGRRRVLDRFTWQVTARGTAECYAAVMDGRPLSSRPQGSADAAPVTSEGAEVPTC